MSITIDIKSKSDEPRKEGDRSKLKVVKKPKVSRPSPPPPPSPQGMIVSVPALAPTVVM